MPHFDINGILLLGAIIILYYLVMLPYWDFLDKPHVEGNVSEDDDDDFDDAEDNQPIIET